MPPAMLRSSRRVQPGRDSLASWRKVVQGVKDFSGDGVGVKGIHRCVKLFCCPVLYERRARKALGAQRAPERARAGLSHTVPTAASCAAASVARSRPFDDTLPVDASRVARSVNPHSLFRLTRCQRMRLCDFLPPGRWCFAEGSITHLCFMCRRNASSPACRMAGKSIATARAGPQYPGRSRRHCHACGQIGASSHEFHDARNAVYALDNEVQVAGRGESMMNAVMGLVYVWEKWVHAATAVIHDRQRALATAREDVGSPVMSTARCSSKHDEAMLDLDAEFAELMSCMHRLAHAHCKAANRLLVRNALRAELRKLPPEAESAASTGQLGDEAAMRVHFTRCHALWRAVLDTIKTRPDYGPRCSFTLHVTSCLCNVLSSLERHEEAEPMERMLLATREAILGAAHEKCVRTKGEPGNHAEQPRQGRGGDGALPRRGRWLRQARGAARPPGAERDGIAHPTAAGGWAA